MTFGRQEYALKKLQDGFQLHQEKYIEKLIKMPKDAISENLDQLDLNSLG